MQRVFIYGSCVTRDGVELWPDYGFELAGYVARQSLVSAVAPARADEFRTAQIPSAFQRRMAEGDIRGNVVAKLTTAPDSFDVIIWDITDERLGVYPVPSGGYVSRVVDYTNGIYVGSTPLARPILIGTEEHRALWTSALAHFIEKLDAAGVRDRLILNAMPWATHNDQGEENLRSGAISPESFNSVLGEFCHEVERYGVRVARTPAARTITSTDHRWGPAPFHYVEDTYRASLDAIAAAL